MFGYVSLGKVRKSTFDGKVAPLQVWLVWQNLVFAQLIFFIARNWRKVKQ